MAAIKDEEWLDGELLSAPERFIENLKRHNSLKADILTFGQNMTDPVPRLPVYYQWDSVAVIPVTSYSDWWKNRVSNHLRQDVNRAAKRGVVVRPVAFTDEFVEGIVRIYNETPIRQGRPFWHYTKGFDATRQMNATYLERSEFLGAYLGDELIGFLKLVYVNRVARLMQILAMEEHRDKRPMNALIGKAVELCEMKACSHLVYGNYRYFQGPDGLTAFKHKNGFEELLVPRYYIPLSAAGSLAIWFRLERGPRALVPAPVLESLRRVRASINRHLLAT
jgi:hypothetical protein